MTLEQFSNMLDTSASRCKAELELDLLKIGELGETMAASYPGHYQAGWAPLKPETIAKKATGDSPLLETGAMRDSIKKEVDGLILQIGSTDRVALYQELGTSRIPPRPFLGLAMMNSLPFARDVLIKTFARLLLGRR